MLPQNCVFLFCGLFHVLYFTEERFKNACGMLPEGRHCFKLNHYISHILCKNYLARMVKNLPAMQETGFDPWVGKIPWRKEWQPTPVFLPGESHGQRNLGWQKLDTTEQLTHILLHKLLLSNYYIFLIVTQFSCSVMSNSLQPHGLQHARPPCPSPTPTACSHSHPSSQ